MEVFFNEHCLKPIVVWEKFDNFTL
jgi:hypothetical protein